MAALTTWKHIDIGDYYADGRRFRTLTGWQPRVRVAEGLAATLDYFRQVLSHYI